MMFHKFMVLFIHMNDQYTLSLVSTLAPKPSFYTSLQAQFPHWPPSLVFTLAPNLSFHTGPQSSFHTSPQA